MDHVRVLYYHQLALLLPVYKKHVVNYLNVLNDPVANIEHFEAFSTADSVLKFKPMSEVSTSKSLELDEDLDELIKLNQQVVAKLKLTDIVNDKLPPEIAQMQAKVVNYIGDISSELSGFLSKLKDSKPQ